MATNVGDMEITLRMRDEVSRGVAGAVKKFEELNKSIENAEAQAANLGKKFKSGDFGKSIDIGKATKDAAKHLDTLYTRIDLFRMRFNKLTSMGVEVPGINKMRDSIREIMNLASNTDKLFSGGKWNTQFAGKLTHDLQELAPSLQKMEKEVTATLRAEAKAQAEASREAARAAKEAAREVEQEWNRYLQQIQSVQRALQNINATERNLNQARATNTNDLVRESIDKRIEELNRVKSELIQRLNDFGGKKGAFMLDNDVSMFTTLYGRGGLLSEYNAYAKETSSIAKKTEKDIERENRVYSRSIDTTREKIAKLKEERSKLTSAISKGDKLGVDTSDAQRSLTEINNLLKEYRRILATSKGDVVRNDMVASLKTPTNLVVGDAHKNLGLLNQANREAERTAQANAKAQADLVRQFQKFNNTVPQSTNLLKDFVGQFRYLIGGMGIQQLLSSIITVGGEIEQQHIALRNIVGSLSEADALFAEIKGLALESPFTFGELNRDVKQLMAYGVEIGNIYETTKRLGDVSAGLGVSFERIALAYGQTKAREWLDAKELRQFAYAGIPLQAELAKLYTQRTGDSVSTKDVQKMIKNRQVGFEDVQTVLFNMTKEGGKFYEQQSVLAETLLGKWNKLKDAWEIMMSDFASGESIIGRTMKIALEGVTSLVLGFHKLLPFVATFFATFTARKIGAAFASIASYLSVGGKTGRNFLSAKQSLASEYQAKALAGKKLTAVEQQILNTKRQITREDIRQLQTSGALNVKEAERLRLASQTRMQYLKSLALMRQGSIIGGMKGMAGVGLGAIKGAANGLMGFLGGPWGAGLTAASLAGMYFYEDHRKTQESYDRNAQAIKDTHKNLQDFLTENPLVMSFTTKEDEAATYKLLNDKFKEIMGYDFAPDSKSDKSAYEQLHQKITDLEYAADKAKDLSKVMTIINNKSNGFFDESLIENVNDYVGALKDYNAAVGSDNREEINDLKSTLSDEWDTVTKDAEKAFYTLKKHVSSFGVHAEDVFKLMVRDFAKSSDELSADAKEAFIDMLDLQWAMDNGAEGVNKLLTEKILTDAPDIRKAIHDMFLDGKTQEEIGEEIGSRVNNATITAIKDHFPEMYNQLQSYVDSQPLLVNVILSVKNGTTENALRDALIGNLNMGPSELKERAKAQIESISKGTIEEANKAAIDNRDNLKKEIARAKKLKGYDPLAIAKLEEDLKVAEAVVASGNFSDYHKNSGNKKDVLAETWKKRLSLMKEYASEYDKWVKLVGKNEALAKMKEQKWDDVFGETFNYEDSRQAIRDYLKSNVEGNAKTDAQKEALKNFMKEIFGFDADDAQKEIDALTKDITKQIDDAKKKWELYTKAKESTSDRGIATQLAFGGDVQFENSMEYFANMIKEFIKKNNIDKSFDEVVAMTDFTSLGDKIGKPLEAMVKAYSDAMNKLADDTVSNYLRIVKESANYGQQVADIRKKLEQDLQDLRKQGGTSEQESWLRKKADENISKVLFEQFKETSGWTDLFDDLARVSTDSLSAMEDKIKTFAAAQKLSIQDTKALTDAMRKLREENIKRNPFEAIAEGFKANPFETFMKNNKKNEYGLWNLWDLDVAKRLGVKAGVYTDEEMEKFSRDYNSKAMDNFIKGLNAVVTALKAFEDILKPVADLFSALGHDRMADFIGIGSNALGTAASVGGAFQTLSQMKGLGFLEAAGPWGAAAGAALSIATSIVQLHDKSIQKEIDASKQRQKEAQNLFNNLKSTFERTLGGGYSNSSYAQDSLNALKAQRDEIAKQQKLEEDKKNKDKTAIADYQQAYKEIDEQIKYYMLDLAKELYGIDVKGWASQLASAVVDAWAQGTDAVKAYGDAVDDIMKNLVTNVVTQMIMEKALKAVNIEDIIGDAIADDTQINQDEIAEIYNALTQAGDIAVGGITGLLDQLKAQGVDLGETKTTNGTLSTNIQNITESTADLLASYLNAIRGYVAQDNLMLTTFFSTTVPEMSEIQRSQLVQLDAIASFTERNALAAERMESIFNAVTNGTKKLYVQ